VLAALLLAGLFAAPLSSALMFVPLPTHWPVAGALAYSRRFVSAVVATVALAAIGYGLSVLVGTTPNRALIAAIAATASSVALLPATRRWNGRAHVCWATCSYLYVAYLVFIIQWTFASHLGLLDTIGGVVLWVLEVVAGLLAGAYLWELCDALGTQYWRRRVVDAGAAVPSPDYQPFVSLHVPAHNEPPEMVIQTLTALTRLNYRHYEIVAIDDNTDDPDLWRPVEAWCRTHGVKFAHLEDWPGYKSGALNYALRELTDPRAELIAVVDSDYQIRPNFLAGCARLFIDPGLGFVQAPQDYRSWRQSRYYRRLYYSYRYFFAVSQPSRNERDAAIFAGTMGIIRRKALDDLGGWDEWCITEDAELSLRMLRAGWTGLSVDRSYGQGIMPLTFEALKSQRYRWCFGGIQILRMYWRSLLPGPRTDRNRLTLGQRWGYLSGGLQWYGDVLGLIFFLFLLAGAANLALGGGELFRRISGFLVAAVPTLVLLGLLRAVALLRRGTGASWRDAFGSFFIWQATSLVVARASVQGLFAKEAVFIRTPKTFDRASWWDVIKANRGESLLAACGAIGLAAALSKPTTLSGPLLAALLLFPTLGFAAAPFNSFAAQRAALPPDLRHRRRTEFLRQPAARGAAVALSGLAVGAGATAAIFALLVAAPTASNIPSPPLVAPPAPSTSAPAPTPSGTPSPTPTSSPTASPTAAPTPSTTPSTTPSPSPSATPTPTTTPSTTPSTTTAPTPTGTPTPAAAPATP
jgi:cellulose synthase/poly-beta-1,6-N-acetylglucosamine synthase-like glycosyltransferase